MSYHVKQDAISPEEKAAQKVKYAEEYQRKKAAMSVASPEEKAAEKGKRSLYNKTYYNKKKAFKEAIIRLLTT